MGSCSTKVAGVVPSHVKAVASPIAPTQQNHRRSNETNEGGPCQGNETQPLNNIFTLPRPHDDIHLEYSVRETTSSRRRYSEPTKTATMATEVNIHGVRHLAAFESFIAERDLMAMGAVSEVFATQDAFVPVQEKASDPEEPEVQCIACCAQLPKEKDANYTKEVVKPCISCNSAYCVSCARNMFLEACKDSARMPPRCCLQIHLHIVKPHLTTEEITEYKLKYEEWSTPKPFYCPTPVCSAFISERLLPQQKKGKVDSGVGIPTPSNIQCPKCEGDICVDCRQVAHPGSLCANLELGVDAETAALLKAWGYKRCPKCSQGLKRMYGCNHMECRCGAHFCWGCLKSRDECEGGCYEDEDEDDESDFEPDEPEPQSEPDENSNNNDDDSENNTDEARVEVAREYDLLGTGTTTEAIEQDGNDSSATLRPIPRPRNLDGGSAYYWENQDLDFGEEPTDDVQDATWDCSHSFEPYAISLAEAISTPPLTHEMECVKCWSAIQPDIETQSYTRASSAVSKTSPNSAVRGRGGRRGRGHGMVARLRPVAYVIPRGLVRSDATVGTAPHLVARLPPASRRPTEARSDPMEGIRFESEVDSDQSEATAGPRTAVSGSNVFGNSSSTIYSVAQCCTSCNLLVCRTCADLILARIKADEDENEAQEEVRPEEDTDTDETSPGSGEVPVPTDDDEQPPPSLFD